MRYGIFSDVHGNLEALEEVLEKYKEENIDKYLCVGDLVGYGANPKECIQKIKGLKAEIVAGNHDWAAVGLTDTTYFRPVAKQAIIWTATQLDEKEKKFLKSLKLVYKNKDLIAAHGTLNDPEKFQYLLDSDLAQMTFDLMKKNICFVGHSHVLGAFITDGKKTSYSSKSKIKIEKNKKYIINVGSVGQPRDRNSRAAFCIFDTEKNEINLKRTNYNIEEAQKKIAKAGLPQFLAARLASGM